MAAADQQELQGSDDVAEHLPPPEAIAGLEHAEGIGLGSLELDTVCSAYMATPPLPEFSLASALMDSALSTCGATSFYTNQSPVAGGSSLLQQDGIDTQTQETDTVMTIRSPSPRDSPRSGDASFSWADEATESAIVLPAVTSPTKYCPMPWPADMVESPQRRFLWQHFLQVTEKGFLCFDVENLDDSNSFQDPFIVTLPHLAIFSDTLRKAALCFSSFQYNSLGRVDDYSCAFPDVARDASRHFLTSTSAITQAKDPRETLATIAAGTLLHHFSPDCRPPYLQLAIRLTSSLLGEPSSRSSVPQIIVDVVLTLLRWTVISSTCSLITWQNHRTLQHVRSLELADDQVGQNLSHYSHIFNNWIDHPLYAFSPRLVNPLLRIGVLLQLRQLISTHQHVPEGSGHFQDAVSEAEDSLLNAQAQDLDTLATRTTTDPDQILYLNEAMRATASILLYARLRNMPFTAPFIRRLVRIVVDQIAKIKVNSRTYFAVIFPLFTAGCEAADLELREQIEFMLRTPRGLSYNRGDLIPALEHIWQIRDLDPGLEWPLWLEKVEPQHRIGCLM
ncbi:unnamed protein product [Clonostachys byssicola]|uniref:Fungal-specific transcription factor domain-containing protein n=1 Tax=Clonostachys byssicola TaxID=160290 RepID=A0A9N9UFL1_9HYPO|nr:unnamed protein product [Clonostachys byssicola]